MLIDGSSDWMEAWWKHIIVGHTEGEDVQMQAVQHSYADDDMAEKSWKLDKGKGLEDMVHVVDKETTHSDTLTTMSDGGVLYAGTHRAKAGYG